MRPAPRSDKTDAHGQPTAASVSTLLFDLASIGVVANPHKAAENHPDHHLEVRTPRGRVLRVGSVWSAISERTKRPYFSLALTDRMGRSWRMNAVRNDESPEREWAIVPLAGGPTLPIALTGRIEALDDGHLAGSIGSYDFDMDFAAVENAHKAEDSHPDWHLEARSPGGVAIRMGSVWRAVSRSGRDYLSLAFLSPLGTQHRANALPREGAPGAYEIVALAGGEVAAVA